MASIGYATLQVIPSMRGTAAALTSESGAVGTSAATAFGGGFNRVLSGGLIAAGVVAATGAALITIGSQFDDAYDAIQTGTGATGDALEGLKDVFRDVVADVPADFDSAAEAISLLNTRLELTGKPLEDLSEQFLNLSHITGDDLSRNLDGVTRAFGDWSVATEDQSDVLDRFFKASQASGVSVGELAEGVVQFGSPLRQLGFSLDESIALFASFGEAGVNTSTVMAGMRQAVKNFGSGFAEAETGMSSFDDVLWQVEHGMFDLSDAMTIFGTRAGPDMYAALQEGRFELGDFLEAMNDTGDGINDTADKTRDFGESFDILKNNVMLLLEGPATRLMDWLSDAAEGLADFAANIRDNGIAAAFDDIRDSIGELSVPMQTFVTALGGLVVGGAVLAGLGGLATVLGALASPLLLVVAGGAALTVLITNWDELSGPMQVFTVLLTAVTVALTAYVVAVTAAKAATVFTGIVSGVSSVTGPLATLGGAFGLVGGAAAAAGAAIALLVLVIVGSVAYIVTHWQETLDFLRNTWMALQNLASTVFNTIAGVISTAWSTIASNATTTWQAITGTVRTAWDNIKNVVRSGIDAVVSFLSSLPGRAVSAVAAMVSGLTNKGREAMQGMFNALQNVWDNVRDWLSNTGQRVISAVGNLARTLYDKGAAIIQGLWDGMQAVWDSVSGWISGIADTISGFFSGLNPFESASLDINTTTTAGPALSAFPVEAVSSRYSGESTQTRVVVEAAGVDTALVEWLRRSVRVESGGNVQAYLGA